MKKIYITIVVLISLSLFMFAERFTIYDELFALKLIPQEEHFTELYFDTYPRLGVQELHAGEVIAFTFSIRNDEGSAMEFPYRVYVEGQSGQRTNLAQSSISIENGALATISPSFTVRNPNQKLRIVVELTDLQQRIDFQIPQN